MKTLHPKQEEAKNTLLAAIDRYGAALDASDTGVGKTVVGCRVALESRRPVAVVAPKIVLPSWREELAEQGVEPIFVLSYEKIRGGRTPYLKKKYKRVYEWDLPQDTLLIFDECHKSSGHATQNAALHIQATEQGIATLNLSATAATAPTKMQALGYALKLHNNKASGNGLPSVFSWWKAHGCWRDAWRKWQPSSAVKHMIPIHEAVFREGRGVRLTTADLPDAFRGNRIVVERLDFGPSVKKFYANIGFDVDGLLGPSGSAPMEEHFIVELLRARQLAELQKVPVMVDMIRDLLEEGKSVVVFLNFSGALEHVASQFPDAPRIEGGQAEEVRYGGIRSFQNNEKRLILCNTAAGGAGLSLHDVHGDAPRVSLISPSFDPVALRQVLGRVHRNGMKSSALQRILVARDTIEEEVVAALMKKIKRLDTFHGEA